jgi:hypothetical protein
LAVDLISRRPPVPEVWSGGLAQADLHGSSVRHLTFSTGVPSLHCFALNLIEAGNRSGAAR